MHKIKRLYFNINDLPNNSNLGNYYFMINFYLWNDNFQLIFSNSNISITLNPNGFVQSYNANNKAYQNGFYTAILKYNSPNIIYSRNALNLYFNIPFTANLYIRNVDIVINSDIGLNQYYETYYGQIEDNYNSLLNDYNDLQDNYEDLENDYNRLDSDYETLADNYNNLRENSVSSIIKNSLNGTTAKLFQLNDRFAPNDNLSDYVNNNGVYQETISYSNTTTPYYSLSDCNPIINSIIYNGGSYNNVNYVNNYCAVFYSFSIPVSLDSLIFERGDTTGTRYINIWFSDNTMTQLTIDEGSDNRHYVLFTNSESKLITNILCTAQVDYNAINSFSVPNSTAVYSSGYDSGYNSGYDEGLDKGYENGIKANNIDTYNRGFNDGASQNLETGGMKTLFNAILSYPVNMIKSVFDFEFMGINVSSFIMFIISIGIVAFVIKKFL